MSVKNLTILTFVANISLLIELIVLEFTSFTLAEIFPAVILSGLAWIGCIVYFLYLYFHNKKKVLALKQEYLNTLKPKFPLRFCPSDTELLKAYDNAVAKSHEKNKVQQNHSKPNAKAKQLQEHEPQME